MLKYAKRDDIFNEKAKNDDETSNCHKSALEYLISVNNHFSESLRKDTCVGGRFAIF